jgi:zinc and cadmium transporter
LLAAILLTCLAGGLLSVLLAAVFALNARPSWIPTLISYAVGALLGAVFLELLPHIFEKTVDYQTTAMTILAGILVFFILEKLVLWRHCHEENCETHDPDGHAHTGEHGSGQEAASAPTHSHTHTHTAQRHAAHEHGRTGLMITVGDTIHNFVDGVVIAAAFMADMRLGFVTALAILAHEIPQEIGDFVILLHSGYSKKQALILNLVASFATVVGALLAYFLLQSLESWVPVLLCIAASNMIYVAIADLIPGLHKRAALSATLQQVSLILAGIGTVWGAHFILPH